MCFRPYYIVTLLFLFFLSGCLHAQNIETYRDIQYRHLEDTNPKLLSLDIYTPKSGKNHPVIIMIHGGSWQFGDKGNIGVYKDKAEFFTGHGYIFISINYRLSPAVKHPAQVRDVAAAIAFVHDHIRDYSGNPEMLFVMGHSAGAHLAALVATDGQYLKEQGKDLSVIKGVVCLDTASYDIPCSVEDFNEGNVIRRNMMERVFGKDASAWKDASPINHIQKGKHIPPFLIFYVASREPSKVLSRSMAEALTGQGIAAETVPVPETSHAGINNNIGKPGDMPTEKILLFFNQISGTEE